jgi:hypothetical protein
MLFSIFFIAIFLIVNHLHSTVASLIVSKVDGGQSLNLTHSLAKRDYTPNDQRCGDASRWRTRKCRPATSDRTWEDECVTTFGGMTITTYVLSSCPLNTICSNILSPAPDYKQTIACNDRPEGETESSGSGQTGVIAVGSVVTRMHTVLVPVLSRVAQASVSALIEGMYYIFSPSDFCYRLSRTMKAPLEIMSFQQIHLSWVPYL